MKVLISQCMRDLPEEEILKVRKKAEKFLTDLGHEVADSYFGDDFIKDTDKNPPLKYLAESIKVLATCDAIYLCNNWQMCRGCRIEFECAKEYGLQVLYEV